MCVCLYSGTVYSQSALVGNDSDYILNLGKVGTWTGRTATIVAVDT